MRIIRIYEWLRIKNFIKMLVIFVMVFSVFAVAYAADYTVLAPLPGIDKTTNLSTYLPAAFNLAIGIAAALAFVVITWGGIVYATSDAITGKQQGKEWVTNAIWGLLLVIGAWAILNTINPQILSFNLTINKPNIPVGVPTASLGIPMTEQALADDQAVRARLIGVTVNKTACTVGQVSACTNLNGLPDNAINGLNRLEIACGGCNVVITGGTEGGHLTHGAGAPIVDLGKEAYLNNYIYTNKTGPVVQTNLGPKYPVSINGQSATFLDEGSHWHVVFN